MIDFLAITWLILLGLSLAAILLRWGRFNVWSDLTGPHWLAALVSFLLMLCAILLFPSFYSDFNSRWYPYAPYRPGALLGSATLLCLSQIVYWKYVAGLQVIRKRRRKKATLRLQRRTRNNLQQ